MPAGFPLNLYWVELLVNTIVVPFSVLVDDGAKVKVSLELDLVPVNL